MKLRIVNTENADVGEIELPGQFSEPINPDLIRRAALAVQLNRRKKIGSKPSAGKRPSAEVSRRRRNYRGSYGIGISRVPRKVMSHRGRRFIWEGAFAPGTVGGRRAHPPKSEKDLKIKINKKERRKAIRSAIAATVNSQLVTSRGHKVPKGYPFVAESVVEKLNKTKNVFETLNKWGLLEELKRSKRKKVRAGKGKRRGRPYRKKTGPLLVVSKKCSLSTSAKNIPGVDVVTVSRLNADLLAPGCQPGRLSVFTKAAVEEISSRGLFK